MFRPQDFDPIENPFEQSHVQPITDAPHYQDSRPQVVVAPKAELHGVNKAVQSSADPSRVQMPTEVMLNDLNLRSLNVAGTMAPKAFLEAVSTAAAMDGNSDTVTIGEYHQALLVSEDSKVREVMQAQLGKMQAPSTPNVRAASSEWKQR